MSDKKKPAPKSQPKPVEAVDVAADMSPFDMSAKHTPEEWMLVLGKYTLGPRCGRARRRKMPLWQHNCASATCGWEQHKHDANESFRLHRDDYEGALKAAESPPYEPPAGARSPFSKLKFHQE